MRVRLSGIAVVAAFAVMSGGAVAKPQSYTFDKTHTAIRASWDHFGYSRHAIEFTNYDGVLLLDFEKPSKSKVEVSFSLVPDGFWVGAQQDRFQQHLASPDFFDVATFPTATFKATKFETADGVTGVMTGDLTIRDKTHPVALDVVLRKKEPMRGTMRAGFSARGTIDRTRWDMGYGAPGVPAEIDISIETELVGPKVEEKK